MENDEIKCGDRVFVTKSEGINPSRAIDMFRRQSSLVTRIKDGIVSLYIIDQYGINHYAEAPIENLVKVKESLKANSDEDRYDRYREGKWNFISQEDFISKEGINFLGRIERAEAERICKRVREDSDKDLNPEENRIVTPFQDLVEKERLESYRRAVAGQIAVKLANIDNHSPDEVGIYAVETATMVVKHLREMTI